MQDPWAPSQFRYASHAIIPGLSPKVHYLEVNAILMQDLRVKDHEGIRDALWALDSELPATA